MKKEEFEQEELHISSIEELSAYSSGRIVKLPDFAEGQPFVAKIKRPSLLALIKSGKIPNTLLKSANRLFSDGGIDNEDEKALGNIFEILDIVCDASFVEPKYSDIKKAGVELTDDQYMFIFNYAQNGVKALETFRTE